MRWKKSHKVFFSILAALVMFFLVMIVIRMAGCGNNHEYFYRSWKISILFIFFMAIVYYAAQKWLPETILKRSVIAISFFFFLTGCFAFASPMETQEIVDGNSGNMKMAYCPVCERLHRNPFWPIDHTFCPKDGARLVKDRNRFLATSGDHTTDAPVARMWHEGGRAIQVPANKMATPLSFTLKKGERLRIRASGEVKGANTLPLNKEVGPEGWQMLPFNDARFLCGGSYMALCVKVGSQSWQECGSECTVEPVEDDTHILFAPNEAQNDLGGKFHQEWFDDNSGSFTAEYQVL